MTSLKNIICATLILSWTSIISANLVLSTQSHAYVPSMPRKEISNRMKIPARRPGKSLMGFYYLKWPLTTRENSLNRKCVKNRQRICLRRVINQSGARISLQTPRYLSTMIFKNHRNIIDNSHRCICWVFAFCVSQNNWVAMYICIREPQPTSQLSVAGFFFFSRLVCLRKQLLLINWISSTSLSAENDELFLLEASLAGYRFTSLPSVTSHCYCEC